MEIQPKPKTKYPPGLVGVLLVTVSLILLSTPGLENRNVVFPEWLPPTHLIDQGLAAGAVALFVVGVALMVWAGYKKFLGDRHSVASKGEKR